MPKESKTRVKRTALPPDPEHMNEQRAGWAAHALDAFNAATGTEPENLLSDLLCDLMHWADRHEGNFAAELARATRSYVEETTPY
jgi:hypothetical protein